jgi:8-oxo-dGTP pyrophosphatase MutT (NUDIX family)
MQDYVLIFVYRRADPLDVLLILKDRPAWQAGKYNLPGGKIEPGETPVQAAHRELFEETGYKTFTPNHMKEVGRMIDNGSIIYCMVAVIDDAARPKPQEGETEKLEWVDWREIVNSPRLIPNLRVLVPLFLCRVEGFVIEDSTRSSDTKLHSIRVSVPSGK